MSWTHYRLFTRVDSAEARQRQRAAFCQPLQTESPSEEELRTELAREAEAIRLAMELGEQEASRGNEE